MVRGFGREQSEQRLLTDAKIASQLYQRPCTYQTLWRSSKIHRNELRQRLDSLVQRRIVIKCTKTQLYKFVYYCLNISNKETEALLNYSEANLEPEKIQFLDKEKEVHYSIAIREAQKLAELELARIGPVVKKYLKNATNSQYSGLDNFVYWCHKSGDTPYGITYKIWWKLLQKEKLLVP